MNVKDLIDPIEHWECQSGTRSVGKSYIQSLLDEKDEEIEKLKQENAVLKTQILNKDRYSYGIRMGGDKK